MLEIQKPKGRKSLLVDYNLLRSYATAVDKEASAVLIRLKEARQAAEDGDHASFEQPANGIKRTLDERRDALNSASDAVHNAGMGEFLFSRPLGPTGKIDTGFEDEDEDEDEDNWSEDEDDIDSEDEE